MTDMKIDRRQMLKLEAAAIAAVAAGMPAAARAANLVTEREASELKWDKAACRFCGTGCSVMVATKDNRVVATHGDIKAEVNRGLNCVKGYFLSKIMYGHDRLTHPMLRKTNGQYDKNGEFTPVSWDEAFDIMALKYKDALKKRGCRWCDGSDGRLKAWYIDVCEPALDDEISFLRREIYLRDVEPRLQRLTAFERYSHRA